jgi:hypothetical protein
MADTAFVGAWKLLSYELRGSDGSVQRPLGMHPAGRLMYDASGRMMGQCVDPDRSNFAHNNHNRGSLDEIKAAFIGCVAYYGVYVVDEAQGTVTHKVQGSLFPNWTGTDQVRRFRFEGNRLILSTPPIKTAGREITGMLVWEREA